MRIRNPLPHACSHSSRLHNIHSATLSSIEARAGRDSVAGDQPDEAPCGPCRALPRPPARPRVGSTGFGAARTKGSPSSTRMISYLHFRQKKRPSSRSWPRFSVEPTELGQALLRATSGFAPVRAARPGTRGPDRRACPPRGARPLRDDPASCSRPSGWNHLLPSGRGGPEWGHRNIRTQRNPARLATRRKVHPRTSTPN